MVLCCVGVAFEITRTLTTISTTWTLTTTSSTTITIAVGTAARVFTTFVLVVVVFTDHMNRIVVVSRGIVVFTTTIIVTIVAQARISITLASGLHMPSPNYNLRVAHT